MRKFFLYSSILFFISSFIILYFSPDSVQNLRDALYTSDLMFPFSVYEGIFHHGSRLDWVFGGYTPFTEIFFGLLFWLLTRNIQLTYVLYAILQPIFVVLSLLYLTNRLFGKNWKIYSLIIIFSAIPILIFSTGHFQFLTYLFSWYLHITTACFALIGLGALIQYVSVGTVTDRLFHPSLLILCGVTILAAWSDALFIAQFVVPAVVLLVCMVLFAVVPFRRAVIAGLGILYATAAGLGMYQVPRLWGSDRLILYGSYMKPDLQRILENWPFMIESISSAWEGQTWIGFIWALFYLLCLVMAGFHLWRWRQGKQGLIQKRYLLALSFLLIQMVTSIGAGFVSNDPALRYFLPAVFIPLFWGWPLIAVGVPTWMKLLRGRRASAAGFATAGLTAMLLILSANGADQRPNLVDYYPNFIKCMDENASRLGLHRGIAHYWQARPITLLSKIDLVVVQVTPDLAPFRILNNSDGYREDFDFVIINRDHRPGHWIDRELVLNQFGDPASNFTCGDSDILVYNRASDILFRRQFDGAPILEDEPVVEVK